MTEKSRIVVNFSMSVLERTEAGKLIKTYEKEFIKLYGYIGIIKRIAGYIFFSAAMFTLLLMVMQIIGAPHDNSLMSRIRVLNIILLALFGVSLVLFNIQDMLLHKFMKKNEAAYSVFCRKHHEFNNWSSVLGICQDKLPKRWFYLYSHAK
jgi:hypothetical protein